jgi:CRISPR-associated protein Csd1
VRRSRAEQRVTMQRAALMKLALPSIGAEDKEKIMVQLDTSNPNAGYQCGRLLAVLEEAQRRAIPGINATLVDRYYGSASSAPASVFAHLLTGVQPHLSKLERDRRGTYLALQSQLEEVLGAIRDFPRTLSLGDQGRFALGYYHQRAFNRQQAREAAARRQQTPTTDSQAAQQTPPTAEEEDNAQ